MQRRAIHLSQSSQASRSVGSDICTLPSSLQGQGKEVSWKIYEDLVRTTETARLIWPMAE